MVTADNIFRNFPLSALEGSLTARFESVVPEFSDRLAVTDGERAWTFLELNSSANGIAMRLLSDNEAIGEPVVLLCKSGPLLVAAILAVLKVGRFYIPLDPTQPIGRLRTIMSDIPHATLLCEEGLKALAVQVLEDGNRILWISHLLHAERNPVVAVMPSATCYVLFTSGSTGSPKPILQTHRNVLFDIRRLTDDFAITPQDHFALLYNPGFSASVGPIFGALLNGASLHIYTRLHERLTELASWLRSEAISICDISLMAFREITRTGIHGFPQMRAVGLGGEQVHRQDFDRFRRCFPAHCVLQNGYGTTETRTICQFLLHHDSVFEGCVVPIGWPVDGKTVLLRDADDRDVATGEAGEIVARSAYLSPGYWNKPELTRQALQRVQLAERLPSPRHPVLPDPLSLRVVYVTDHLWDSSCPIGLSVLQIRLHPMDIRDCVVHRWFGLDDCRSGPYVLPNANLDFTFITAFGEVLFILWLWIRGWKVPEPAGIS